MADYRVERDSLGPVDVPADALWGAQTQRAVDNFNYSGLTMPRPWILAMVRIKQSSARVNQLLGELDGDIADAIVNATDELLKGAHADQFPVDVFQTGSGTSSNMNANEVIAALAGDVGGKAVHPNDHVNRGQSSNDTVPSANQLSAALRVRDELLPAVEELISAFEALSDRYGHLLKTGRTHLMDAMPLSVEQEIDGWVGVLSDIADTLEAQIPQLSRIALGGTAVGTGINAHPEFGDRVAEDLAAVTGLPVTRSPYPFSAQSGQSDQVALSGTLKNLATWLIKISNDLRWMNSGPLAGLSEVQLPALQPGSSIMPGKVNPVIPEAVIQAAFQVIGNDTVITLGAQNSQFQLNTALPLITHNMHQSLDLMTEAMNSLSDEVLPDLTYREDVLAGPLARNPILATALNNEVGYSKAAEIAKEAYRSGRPVLEVAMEMTDLPEDQLRDLLDPVHMIDQSDTNET